MAGKKKQSNNVTLAETVKDITERRFKEFDEMERHISNKGILKAFSHALGLITSDLLDAGYDEKKILSFVVQLFNGR